MKTYLLTIMLLFGSTLVFYSISPYFSALGLVIVSLSSCLILSHVGMSFLALILLLVYIGGMLMVFIFSSALTKDRFPVMSKIKEMTILTFFLTMWTTFLFKNQKWSKMKTKTNLSSSASMEGASYLFHYSMVPFFITAGYILLVTLMAMLNISRGIESATLQTL